MAKDSQLRDYLEVYSLSSDKAFLSIQLKTCLEFSGWTCYIFFVFELYYTREVMLKVLIQIQKTFKTS